MVEADAEAMAKIAAPIRTAPTMAFMCRVSRSGGPPRHRPSVDTQFFSAPPGSERAVALTRRRSVRTSTSSGLAIQGLVGLLVIPSPPDLDARRQAFDAGTNGRW